MKFSFLGKLLKLRSFRPNSKLFHTAQTQNRFAPNSESFRPPNSKSFRSQFKIVSPQIQSRFPPNLTSFRSQFRVVSPPNSKSFRSQFRIVSLPTQSRFAPNSKSFRSQFKIVSLLIQSRFPPNSNSFRFKVHHFLKGLDWRAPFSCKVNDSRSLELYSPCTISLTFFNFH